MKINKTRLHENTDQDIEKMADKIDAEVIEEDDTKDEIFEALDDALKTSQQVLRSIKRKIAKGKVNFDLGEIPDLEGITNVLLVGAAGTGKTARVKQWAHDREIRIVNVDAKVLDETDLGGMVGRSQEDPNTIQKLASTELDKLDKPNTVLFLDEFNRARTNIRGTLLEVVNNHVVNDPRTEGGKRFLEGFLFTIAAVNPTNAAYETHQLNLAELGRFGQVPVTMRIKLTLKHINDAYDEEILNAQEDGDEEDAKMYQGRKEIANALLSNPEFEFNTDEELIKLHKAQLPHLSPRSLTNLLAACDGTKDDFLNKWDRFCDHNKKTMAKTLLANYVDIDDRQNAALDDHDKKKKEKKSAFGKSTGNEFRDKGALADIDSFDV